MKQTASDISHLAILSGLNLAEDEAASLGTDVEKIIEYIHMLDELDVTGVEPTYQVVQLQNIGRNDEVREAGVSREQLLALSPKTRDSQVEVPKVL